MRRLRKDLARIPYVLCCAAVALALLTRLLSIRDNQDYGKLQPELVFPDVVTAVLHDEELGQIYVCYNDASYVNVYTEDGEFLWAVSTPYLRNVDFALSDGQLIIAGGEAYIYDAADGGFIRTETAEGIEWGGLQTGSSVYSSDGYNVYRALPGGGSETVVSRPGWYWITNFAVCWLIAFLSALSVGVTILLQKTKAWLGVRKRVVLEDRTARFVVRYFQITSAVQLLYAAGYIVISCMGIDSLSISVMAVAIHFIVSNWVNWNLAASVSGTEEEHKVVSYWKGAELATFLIAFFTVVICTIIVQGA